MTVVSIHCVSETPENDCHAHIQKFIKEKKLQEIKPDFRIIGFNNEIMYFPLLLPLLAFYKGKWEGTYRTKRESDTLHDRIQCYQREKAT